ncbi:MAG: hypothetical protein KatS3mg051_0729 [Anaerolineae bacterium]|nr:MAG: hypothetical protein KatS3mg051_0729 [Anaerolineae bacterium]
MRLLPVHLIPQRQHHLRQDVLRCEMWPVEWVAGTLGAKGLGGKQPDEPGSPSEQAPRAPDIGGEGSRRPAVRATMPPLRTEPLRPAQGERVARPDDTRQSDDSAVAGTERMARPVHPELLRLRGATPPSKPAGAPPAKATPPTAQAAGEAENQPKGPSAEPESRGDPRRAEPLKPGVLETAPDSQATKQAVPPEEICAAPGSACSAPCGRGCPCGS